MKSLNDIKEQNLSWSKVIPPIVLLVLIILMMITNPKSISLSYLGVKCDVALPLILIGAGQTIAIISQGMDLSVGGIMSICTCIMATVSEKNLMLALFLCIMIGMATGLVNSFLITRFNLQPFVATLGTWTVLDGCALAIMKTDGGTIAQPLVTFITAKIGQFSMSFFLILLLLLFWLFIKKTPLLYSIFAVGSNEKAAFCNGINITRVKVITYMASGVFAALGGIAYSGVMNTGSPTVGESNIMMSVAAAVIGGTSLVGGVGSIGGTILGVFILKIISDVLVFAGVTSYWTSLFQGLLMILSVAFGSISYLLKRGGRNYD